VVENGVTGVLHEDLRAAALAALQLDRGACRRHALGYTWEAATRQFIAILALARGTASSECCDVAAPSLTRTRLPGDRKITVT
jgi:hypothetical protein